MQQLQISPQNVEPCIKVIHQLPRCHFSPTTHALSDKLDIIKINSEIQERKIMLGI
jgi:hypothetical protein